MPYIVSGTLTLPNGFAGSGVDISFTALKTYGPLIERASCVIRTADDGAYSVSLEYNTYNVDVTYANNKPFRAGQIFVAPDTIAGQDLQLLLTKGEWVPSTPEWMQQIEQWLNEANQLNEQAITSAISAQASATQAKASETAVETDKAEVAANTSIVLAAQTDVTQKADQVSSDAVTVSQNKTIAVAAADTATQKAASAATHDASAQEAAGRAENAAAAIVGVVLDGGECDLSGGSYPPPVTVAGVQYSTVWYVAVAGVVSGTSYDVGDLLRYTTANAGYYFKVDAKDDVYSVNGEKGAVTVTPEKIGAERAGVAQQLVDQHAAKMGAHQISGVEGLQDALNGKEAVGVALTLMGQHEQKLGAHLIAGVQGLTEALAGKEATGTAASSVTQHEGKVGAHPISGIVGMATLIDTISPPIGCSEWERLRAHIRAGHVPSDGQVLNRVDFPDMWAAILAGTVPVVSDADWLAQPSKRASFTTGDGLTTFRVPDENGKYAGSLGASFKRGDGLNSAGSGGNIQGDVIRDIVGTLDVISIAGNASGVFEATENNTNLTQTAGTPYGRNTHRFKASKVVPTGPENRPVATTGCWVIKVIKSSKIAGLT